MNTLIKTISTPPGSPWFWDNKIHDRRMGKRLQDTALFLLESQNNYYKRALAAIRATRI